MNLLYWYMLLLSPFFLYKFVLMIAAIVQTILNILRIVYLTKCIVAGIIKLLILPVQILVYIINLCLKLCILPIILLVKAIIWFIKLFKPTDKEAAESLFNKYIDSLQMTLASDENYPWEHKYMTRYQCRRNKYTPTYYELPDNDTCI